MKNIFKKELYKFFKSKYSFPIKKIINRLHNLIEKEQAESTRLFKNLINNKIVLSGIFKGMRYPELNAYGSALYPKIIGSYEEEIYPIINKLLKNNYKEIIDVGCAEGYYAVGLALKTNHETIVWAYDTDKNALDMCRRMAVKNKVIEKIKFRELCSPETLLNFHLTNGLILSDCEGYEDKLFTKESVKKLKKCDLIIELHEFKIPNIKNKLINLFSASHTYSIVETKNYYKHITRNPKNYIGIMDGINFETQKSALDEYRPCPMKWLILKRKSINII